MRKKTGAGNYAKMNNACRDAPHSMMRLQLFLCPQFLPAVAVLPGTINNF